MFEGFERIRIEAEGASINAVRGGEAPPVLLLHGSPQTLAMWHLVAPRLAEDFSVVAVSLKKKGDSSKPQTDERHRPYFKRAMALVQIEVMRHFGFERFALCGHDRGGRVGYRMALDHPGIVTKLTVLDIVPTWEAFSQADGCPSASATGIGSSWPSPTTCPSACSPPTPRTPSSGVEVRSSAQRRWRSTRGACETPRPSTPPVRTTGPRPPSTTSTTPRTERRDGAWRVPCSPSGAAGGSWRGTTTSWTSGAGGPRRYAVGRSTAATTSRRRPRRRPAPSCARSWEKEKPR